MKLSGCPAQWLAFVLPDPASPGSNTSILENFQKKNLSMLLRLGSLEGSEQWLENVDQTNLVLASGKPALQKIYWKGGTVAEWSETLLL